jgi:imidazolonepropionase-like amidohydrolase
MGRIIRPMTRLCPSTLVLCLAAACTDAPGPTHPAPPAASGPALLFDDVRVFDGEKVVDRIDVLVRGDHIAEMGAQIAPPAGAEVVPGAGRTLLPGLIDSHVHIWEEKQLAQAAVFGVTTMLDMMTSPQLAASLEQKLATPAGAALADLRSAGNPATAPGGHGTEYGMPIRTLPGADKADEFVEACRTEGSDYIKIIYDPRNPRFPSIDRATLTAVVEAAHRRKLLAVAHIETQEDAREAVEAGVDGLAHLFLGRPPDPDFAGLAASRHVFVIPTLSVLSSLSGQKPGAPVAADGSLSPYLTSSDLDSLDGTFGRHGPGLDAAVARATVAQLAAQGVPILAGTDAPNPGTTYGASLHGELALLVEAGLSPTAALAAATSAPARAFKLDRGRIAAGQRADLLLVDGDPTRDIAATRAIAGVWKLGARIDRDAYRAAAASERSAAKTAAAQAAANAGGLVSDFEQGQPSSRFGKGWSVSTDQMMGGKSRADLAVVAPGARASKGALRVSGEVAPGRPDAIWAGALFSPGAQPMAPIDLSSSKELVFWARGDGKTYQLLLFAKSRGFTPAARPFTAGKSWSEVRFKLADFDGMDGRDLMGVFFGAGSPGPFSFEIDDVAFNP